ncbi:MAG: hypothetical protein H3C34_10135, partial [Caldilineaceae bacterium]|nr:hypothetical protein [Caldilineaceae bacterium]
MRRIIWIGILLGAACSVLFAGLATTGQVAVAQVEPLPTPAPMVDAACRGCHGEKTDELVLASGEILPLGVDLAQLTVSPHSSAAAHPVPCTSCHVNETRYRYPHEENPAQTLAEFRGNVSDSCQECHYPHTPFHEIEQADYTPPTCVDCHGGHDIAGVESMAESVPANCLACHDDQSTEWVAEFLHPLPGFGVGSAEFAGSMRCAGCHEEKFFTWRDTLHARIVQDVAREVDAVVGDFELEDPDRSFTLDDVSYTIGGRLRQLYMTRTVSDTFEILPAQWNVETQEWVPYHLDDGETNDWLQECSGCHVTGLDSETWTFVEFGVGCESCHGTGAAHAADPENVKPYAEVDDQVCGA